MIITQKQRFSCNKQTGAGTHTVPKVRCPFATGQTGGWKMRTSAKLLAILLVFSVLTACSLSRGDRHVNKGLKLYLDGEYEQAVSEFEKAVESGVKKYSLTDLYEVLGSCYLDMDRYDEAIDTFTKATETDGGSVSAWVSLGIAYRQHGDLDKAEECYARALEIDPEYAELRSSLGTLYIVKNEPENAIREFEKALELDPDLAVTYGNAALAYAMTGNWDKADEYLMRSEELGYRNADELREMIETYR